VRAFLFSGERLAQGPDWLYKLMIIKHFVSIVSGIPVRGFKGAF